MTRTPRSKHTGGKLPPGLAGARAVYQDTRVIRTAEQQEPIRVKISTAGKELETSVLALASATRFISPGLRRRQKGHPTVPSHVSTPGITYWYNPYQVCSLYYVAPRYNGEVTHLVGVRVWPSNVVHTPLPVVLLPGPATPTNHDGDQIYKQYYKTRLSSCSLPIFVCA